MEKLKFPCNVQFVVMNSLGTWKSDPIHILNEEDYQKAIQIATETDGYLTLTNHDNTTIIFRKDILNRSVIEIKVS